MFKILVFARRNPALTREEFIARFERDFVPIVSSLRAEGRSPLVEYRRNYLIHDDPQSLRADEVGYDMFTENWFADRSAFIASRDAHVNPETRALIYSHLSQIVDLDSMRYVVVDERVGFA